MERPETLHGRTLQLKTNCGKFYLTLNEHDGRLCEVRMMIGKSGNCVRKLFEFIGILLSLLLQSSLDREVIKKQLESHMEANCGNTSWHEGIRYESCVDFAVKKMFEEMAARNEIKVE